MNWKRRSMISTVIASSRSSTWIRQFTKRRSANRSRSQRDTERTEGSVKVTLPFFFQGNFPDQREKLLAAEAVSDRGSESQNVAGVELIDIANDIVIMRLGTDEEVSPEVVTHACPGVQQEMMAADEGGAESVAVDELVIKRQILESETGHKIDAGPGAKARCEHAIDIGQDGAEVLIAVVEGLVVAECHFGVQAKMILENGLGADAGISSSFFWRRYVRLRGTGGLGREQRAAAGHNVNFLGTGEAGQCYGRTSQDEQSELSQHTSFET